MGNVQRILAAVCICAAAGCFSHADAQLAKPTIAAENVGWGWFDLRMTDNSISPSGTHWLITNADGSQVVFDTWRRRADCDGEVFPGRIASDFVADTRDLTSKSIIGCAANTQYLARVRYTDGTQWSPFSDSVFISTTPEPSRTGDTVYVVLYGHSLAAYNSNCGMYIGDGILLTVDDGYESPGGGNSFGHSLQTELRRITNRNVTVVNWAISGSRQSRWMRSGLGADTAVDQFAGEFYENFIRYYRPADGRYLDTSRYRVAAFFFGQNDAREPQYCGPRSYPPALYAADATSIINELTGNGVRVVYSSIHYGTPRECDEPYRWFAAQIPEQEAYFTAWDSLMNALVPSNPGLWRGLDFFSLFRSDTARYHFPDGIHPNLSEGVPGIVRPLAVIIADAIAGKTMSSPVVHPAGPGGLSLSIVPNTTPSSTTITLSTTERMQVTVAVHDLLGRQLHLLLDDELQPGERAFHMDTERLAEGTYLCIVKWGDHFTAQRFRVSR